MKLTKIITIKIVALVLCAAVLAVSLSGNDFTGAVFTRPGIDTVAAMKTYEPGTVMVSSGDLSVTWDLFYYFLFDITDRVTNGFQEEPDWSETSPAGDTLADLVMGYVVDQAIQALVYEYGTRAMGVSLSEGERESIWSYIGMMISETGGLGNLERDLRGSGFFDLAGFEKLMLGFALQAKLPVTLYGESYSDIPDDVVASYADREGYMLAKHILRTFPSEYDNLTAEETEAAKQRAYNEIVDILEVLNGHRKDEDFIAFFSELELAHSEDLGSLDFPDGYLFQYRDMVPQFSDACDALGYGQISGIVESPYGFHIIFRLPLDYDNIAPYRLASQGQYVSLRQLAIREDFDNRYYQWLDSMFVEFSPELDSLDLATLFAWQE